MAYPSEYDRAYSFTAFSQAQGDDSFPGTQIDNEFDDIELSIDEINEFLENGFRADGHIANGLVTWDSLDAALKAKFQASGAAAGEAVDPALVYAGPPSGPDALPTFRALAQTDLPNLLQGGVSAVPVSLFTRAAAKPQFEDYGQVQKNIAALRAIVPSVDKADILVPDYHGTGNGGGGVFRWDAASTAVEDGGLVIQPTDHSTPGRWHRVVEGNGRVHSKWYGAKGDAATDDTVALQLGIDRAKALGMGFELDIGDYVTGPLKLNGSAWQPTDISGAQSAVLCFVGNGRSPFLCRLIAKPGAYDGDLKAVVTGRNMTGVVVSNFQVDAAGVAESCADLAFLGNGAGGVAPSCSNEFTSLWGDNATRIGFDLDQAADCKISGIQYRGGTAAIGISMQLGGGGIWADTLMVGSGRLRVACQNAGLQNCGFFSGIEISGAALDLIHFDACHIYPYTPRRTLAANPFITVNGSAVVTVSMPGHGLVNGNYVELAGCVDTNGILEADLETTAAAPRAITYIDADSFSIVAGGTATAAGAAGGSTVAITGRGYSVYSSAPNGSGPRSLEMTTCYLNVLGVAGQKHFGGRWLNGARFHGCRLGNNLGEPAATNIYFDATNWTPAGASSTLPLFFFDNCSFSVGRPVAVASKVLVGFAGSYDGVTSNSLQDFEWPGPFNLPNSAFGVPMRLGASTYVWRDAAGNVRTAKASPSADADGAILLSQQRGSGSPLPASLDVTPYFAGADFYDFTNNTWYKALGATSADWRPIADQGADMVAASTLDLATSTGDVISVTGNTTITAFGTMPAGVKKTLRFTGAPTLTHNAASLIIPGAANIVLSGGNAVDVLSLGSGNWAVIGYSSAGFNATQLVAGTMPAARLPTAAITGGTITGITDLAVADGGTGASSAGAALSNLGGQPLDTDLTAIAALTSAADQMPYATGAGTWAMTTVTAAARTLLDDATIALMLTTLTITNATGGTTLGSTNTASGANATAIGSGNTASNTSTVAMGNASQATGSVTVAIGNGAISSGSASVALGQNVTASGSATFVHGNRATDRATAGSRAFAAGMFSVAGDAQLQEAVFRATTAAATATRLTTDAAAASATNVLALANNSSYLIVAECIIRDVTTGKTVTYTLGPSMVERGANAAATAVSAGNPVFVAGPASAVPPVLAAIPTLTADTTNGGLNISFTPPVANTDTYHAVCYVRSTQVV